MNQKKLLIGMSIIIVGLTIALLIQTRKSKEVSKVVPDRVYRMEVVYNTWPGWAVSKRAMERMSQSVSGVRTALSGPADGDTNKQIEELDLLIRQRVNGIILCPGVDAKSLIPIVNKAISNGIPVVTMYDDVPSSARLTYVAADERGTARNFAKNIFKEMQPITQSQKKVRVLVAYMRPGILNQEERLQGVKEALAQAPWMELVDVVKDDANEANATAEISAAWERERKKGGFQLLVGLNARSAIGAITALKEKGIAKGDVIITGWDSDEDVLQAIKDEWVHATTAPNAGFMTQLAVSVLEAHNLGYLYPDILGLQEMDMKALPPRINIEPIYIDKKNVDAFFRKR